MDLQLSSIMKEGAFYFSLVIFLVGVMLVLIPGFFIEKAKNYNAWVDTDKYFDYVNQTRATEKTFYKYSKILSILILILSAYVLYSLVLVIEIGDVAALISFSFLSESLNNWLAQSMIYILIIFNVLALFLSIIIFLRPSALKEIERLANIWFKTDTLLHALDKSINVSDRAMSTQKLRMLGVFVMLGCFYILFFLF